MRWMNCSSGSRICELAPVAMVGVLEPDSVRVDADQALVSDRASPQVAAEVGDDAPRVRVALGDMHVPLPAPETTQEVGQPRLRESGGEHQATLRLVFAEGCQELAPEECADDAEGQQEAVAHGFEPATVPSAPGDQGVDVRVEAQGASPGVQRGEHPGACTEVLLVGEKLEQGVANRAEQPIIHPGPVAVPQRFEVVRDGEDHVIVIAGQELLRAGLDPGLDSHGSALWTRAMAARVVEHARDVSVRADANVAATRSGPTPLDVASRSDHMSGQATRSCVGLETAPKYLLQRGAQARSPRDRAGVDPVSMASATESAIPARSAVCSTDRRSAAANSASAAARSARG